MPALGYGLQILGGLRTAFMDSYTTCLNGYPVPYGENVESRRLPRADPKRITALHEPITPPLTLSHAAGLKRLALHKF